MARLSLAFLLMASCATSRPPANDADFCPGCKTFCGADCPKSDQGVCKACGRAPMQVAGVERVWYGCRVHNAWHAGANCPEDPKSKCCTPTKQVMAMSLPRDTKSLEPALYCPGCRCFCGGDECPLDAAKNCRKCSRPPVRVMGLKGTWYWCTEHRRWHGNSTCPLQKSANCCQVSHAYVLVSTDAD